MSRAYAIRFDFPDTDEPLYAGDYGGALGFAPTLVTARLWDDAEVAQRFLKNGYGTIAVHGRVVAVKDGHAVAAAD